jgi:hypothetical protein
MLCYMVLSSFVSVSFGSQAKLLLLNSSHDPQSLLSPILMDLLGLNGMYGQAKGKYMYEQNKDM